MSKYDSLDNLIYKIFKFVNGYDRMAITPFYISNADFSDIKKIKKCKINSR